MAVTNTFHSGLRALNEERSYQVDDIQGELPAWLRGTFFRNGPGRIEIGGQKFGHWFDGDGMLCAFRFNDQGLHFTNRYVRTPKYVRETALKRIDFRGFGTQRPGGLLANLLRPPANPANTSVVYHAGKLLALNEGGRPFRLDPVTLETVGEYTYDEALTQFNMFSAHGKINPRTSEYFNFGMGITGQGVQFFKPCLYVYRINPQGVLEAKRSIPVDYFPFCHDFAMTEHHAIFFLSSIKTEALWKVMLGTHTFADSVHYDPQQRMQVIVVDLQTLDIVLQTDTDPGALIHFGNAYQNNGEIVLDAMYLDNFDANDLLRDMFNAPALGGGGQYLRYHINLSTGAVAHEKLCDIECEFPQWDLRRTGLPHRMGYSAAVVHNGNDSFFNAIQKLDTVTREQAILAMPLGCFGAEPVFVPRPDGVAEDDGVLLVVVYNANTTNSELWVIDAADVQTIVAKALLPHHIPHQFHGFFAADLY